MRLKSKGLLLRMCNSNGPSAKAGLKRGDKILKVNNEVITSASHLINYVAAQPPNSVVQISIERDKKPMNINVTIAERKVQEKNSESQYIPVCLAKFG